MSMIKTGLLLAALTMLFAWIGHMLGGPTGMIIALGFAAVMNFGAYWFSDKIVLTMYRAHPIEEHQSPELFRMVRHLADRAGLPMPKLYVLPERQPNAFATGRDPQHSAVAVTQGLLELMNRPEVEGVIAHELAHIKNRDTLTMAIVATLAGAISSLAQMFMWMSMLGGRREEGGSPLGALASLLVIFVAPIAAMMVQFAISRTREYEADKLGAQIAGSPIGLADALRRLEQAAHQIPNEHAQPATAHLFIVNPLSGGGFASLFSTHPPIEERVRRLRAMAGYAQ